VTDPLDDGDLRARSAAIRAEWRDDEEAWTRAAFEHWEHRRGLVDVLGDCMARSDMVTLTMPHTVLRGVIVAVGRDVVRIVDPGDDRPDAAIDVQVGAGGTLALRIVGRARPGAEGEGGPRNDATFRAYLLEREGPAAIEVGTFASAEVLVGQLRVSSDHVRVRTCDGDESYVPMSSVAWVRRAR
jgi:hypothetical protein